MSAIHHANIRLNNDRRLMRHIMIIFVLGVVGLIAAGLAQYAGADMNSIPFLALLIPSLVAAMCGILLIPLQLSINEILGEIAIHEKFH